LFLKEPAYETCNIEKVVDSTKIGGF
jgi:hypothetical protein